jgi:hypothetical protein
MDISKKLSSRGVQRRSNLLFITNFTGGLPRQGASQKSQLWVFDEVYPEFIEGLNRASTSVDA